ncbi:MAG TPA: hypothetical protein VE595_04885, partial [Nitrososphaeraceae archaeon]|nr:hypothetical protein [Nitrososphaeraceae archaeon]
KKDVWFAEQRGNALAKVTVKFIPSNPQGIDKIQEKSTIDNNDNTNNQTINNITITVLFGKIRFNDLFGPFIIIALVISTLLYLNSSNQLRKRISEIENIENRNKEKGTKMRTK